MFRYSGFGVQIQEDPGAAHAQLVELFARHGEVRFVAEALGVAGTTVSRWMRRLVEAGYRDPRVVAREAGHDGVKLHRPILPRGASSAA